MKKVLWPFFELCFFFNLADLLPWWLKDLGMKLEFGFHLQLTLEGGTLEEKLFCLRNLGVPEEYLTTPEQIEETAKDVHNQILREGQRIREELKEGKTIEELERERLEEFP